MNQYFVGKNEFTAKKILRHILEHYNNSEDLRKLQLELIILCVTTSILTPTKLLHVLLKKKKYGVFSFCVFTLLKHNAKFLWTIKPNIILIDYDQAFKFLNYIIQLLNSCYLLVFYLIILEKLYVFYNINFVLNNKTNSRNKTTMSVN